MINQKCFKLGILMLILSLYPFPAYAAATNPGTAGTPLFIELGVAYLTRRIAIGGWLFYYYLQLYGSFLVTMLLSSMMIENLQPTGWEDKSLYTMFVLSIVPALLMQFTETVFATRLLFKSQRNEMNVKIFRYILLILVIIDIVSLVIDFFFFRANLPTSIFSLSFSVIWCLYFFQSYRVKCALSKSSGVWDYELFKLGKITELEKV